MSAISVYFTVNIVFVRLFHGVCKLKDFIERQVVGEAVFKLGIINKRIGNVYSNCTNQEQQGEPYCFWLVRCST